jgi:hypothetical protein
VGIVAALHVGEGSGYIRELVVRLDFGWKVCGGGKRWSDLLVRFVSLGFF